MIVSVELTANPPLTAGIEYPFAYATLEQQSKDHKALVFNCCQRAHANTSAPFCSSVGASVS